MYNWNSHRQKTKRKINVEQLPRWVHDRENTWMEALFREKKNMKGTNDLEHRSWLRYVGVIPCHMKGLGGNAYDYGSWHKWLGNKIKRYKTNWSSEFLNTSGQIETYLFEISIVCTTRTLKNFSGISFSLRIYNH